MRVRDEARQEPVRRPLRAITAALLAGCALQGCTQANLLAAIDGPYVPPSERLAAAAAAAAAATVPPPAPASVTASLPAAMPADDATPVQVQAVAAANALVETSDIPRIAPARVLPENLAYSDAQFVGPVLTAPEMAALAAAAAGPEAPEDVALAVAVPPAVLEDLPTSSQTSPLTGPQTGMRADFLPPTELAEPAALSEPVELAAPTEASTQASATVAQAAAPTPGLIGPVDGPDPAPVQLATRLPSAFELTPAPGVPARPARQAATPLAEQPIPDRLDAAAFSAFHAFSLQRLASAAPRTGRLSMLLADPPSLDPTLQTCGNRPPAVLIDLDPAAGLMPLANTGAADARPDAGLVAQLADLRLRGVTIYWISGHGPGSASAIRRRLVDSGLDPAGLDPLIVTRFSGESKQERRQGLGESHCLLAIVGDNRSDFDELYDYVLDGSVAAPLEVHIGNGWFLAPPPLSPSLND